MKTFLFTGEGLYAPNVNAVLLVVEMKAHMTLKTLTKGILCYILAFFVFGLAYPPELSNTLEFYQR